MVHSRHWLSLVALAAAASFLAGCNRPDGPLTVPDAEAPPGAARAGVTQQPAEGGAQPAAPAPGQAEATPPVAE
ncbi:MAG TPA: hypothetical protein VLH79_04585 [Chthonomonadales bacterium]|nr:hypothetical protein [Chthonomonadales bacterium]